MKDLLRFEINVVVWVATATVPETIMLKYLLSSIAFLASAMPALGQTTLDTTAPAQTVNLPTEDDDEDSGVSGLIALGGGIMPKYDGASKYEASPFGLAALRWKGIEFNLVGTELKVDLGGGGRFLYGPVLGMSNSRSVSDAEGPVKLLNPIKDSADFGAFAGFRFGGDKRGQGRFVVSVQATKDTKKEKGMSADVGISYAAIRNKKVFATFDLGAEFNDSKYTRTFFGVTEPEALASGLDRYRPSGGLTKVSAGLTAGYQLSRHWGLLTRIQGGTFTGDAADSPIVKDGSKGYGQALFGISYAF
ncbi:MipA/OmpV family protein [Sphingobium sp. SCG-1]|uniref:MipA/OmpV family protein n=1 Tax=Sphingobium sp. SCG-1 TaxID=2072936 RepID=UPI000CD6A7EA|nr:MipA/OmpV family protein [Sphingobium sp. SCG-1]AUW57712.1 MipA/OmpV family protein [Sphingobium sp. SCG-1]